MKPIEIWDVYFVVPRPFVLSSFQVRKKNLSHDPTLFPSGFSRHHREGPVSISYEKVSSMRFYFLCCVRVDLAVWYGILLHSFGCSVLYAFVLYYIVVPRAHNKLV
jgi:hypothetical protein